MADLALLQPCSFLALVPHSQFLFYYNDLKGNEICIILHPLPISYFTSRPLENSLRRLFSVIQSASVDFSVLLWNSPIHPSLPASFSPSLPHSTSMLEDSLCRPTLHLSLSSLSTGVLITVCLSLISLCLSLHVPLYLNVCLILHTHTPSCCRLTSFSL